MSTTVLPSTTEESLAIVRSTAPKYWKGESDLTFRNRAMLAFLQKYGVIQLRANPSYAQTWTVKYKEPPVTTFVDRADIQFNATQLREQLTIDMVAYKATDSMSLHEYTYNSQSPTQIIDLYRRKSEDLSQQMTNNFCAEIFNDGYTNLNRFKGIESFFATGTTIAADRVAQPSDSYGGNNTTLADKGGAWSSSLTTSPNANVATDWPFGTGDPQYDYLAPLIVNTSSTNWSSTSWEENSEECMQYMRVAQMHRCGKAMKSRAPYIHLFGINRYNDWLTFHRARNTQVVPFKEGIDLGFPDMINFDGTAVTHDYDVGPDVGYYVCPEMMEFFTPQDMLFKPEGPTWSISDQAWLYIITQFGQFRFQPKFFGKYLDVA